MGLTVEFYFGKTKCFFEKHRQLPVSVILKNRMIQQTGPQGGKSLLR